MGDYNLEIKKGITNTLVCTYKTPTGTPINLTGYSVRSQGRVSMESESPVFNFTTGTGITVVPSTGEITLKWTAGESVNYPTVYNGVWSLEVESGDGTVTELLSGQFNVTERPTRV